MLGNDEAGYFGLVVHPYDSQTIKSAKNSNGKSVQRLKMQKMAAFKFPAKTSFKNGADTCLLFCAFQRDVDKRLGCCGGGSDELKDHPFFTGYDWSQVYQQRYTPPLIPPRGEVNAADAFDIGSFDEEDTKGNEILSLHLLQSHSHVLMSVE